MKQKIFAVCILLVLLALFMGSSSNEGFMEGQGTVIQEKEKVEKLISGDHVLQAKTGSSQTKDNLRVATFAGGCFWCSESDFEKHSGVLEVVSGYSGGKEVNPSYEQVASGKTSHREAVQVVFDPKIISYKELLDIYWRHIDPTDAGGSFVDRGFQYSSAIFYHDEEQKKLAEESLAQLKNSNKIDGEIVTKVLSFKNFYVAEDYHQNYHTKNPLRYKFYRSRSGRDQYIENTWGTDPIKETFDAEIAALTPLQYKVTQEDGTEKPFDNKYWDNTREGIYVDIVSGEPLFSSIHKYKSGTGWPSFTEPLVKDNIVLKEDKSLFLGVRTEVRSKQADSHLGHVFEDGPQDKGGLRYCMNSAAMKFIPKEDLEKEGYEEFLSLFEA